LLAGAINFVSYWYSDKLVLRIYGARELSKKEYPELHNSLKELSTNAGLPTPRLYMSDMEMPNAFATGRSPNKGVVCVTRGLLDKLDKDEID
ncbi:MAG: M48 family metalloprotease, partial [Candidatus Aenigmatarchaeota archaeon]